MRNKGRKRKKGGGGGGGSGGGRPQPDKITIVILPDGTIEPTQKTMEVHRNAGPNKPDWVRWDNRADRGVRLIFTFWPFSESPVNIPVEAGKKSAWFHVYVNAMDTSYGYKVDPPLSIGPPGEPQIDVTG